MRRIDGWIIKTLERLCHRTQRLTGVTSAHIANAMFMLASIWLIQELLSGDNKVLSFFGWFILIGFFFSSREALNHKQGLCGEAVANPLKADTFEIYWRVSGMALSGILLFVNWESKNFWFEASVLGNYFAACDDLPASPSKLRQFLQSFGTSSQQQESKC